MAADEDVLRCLCPLVGGGARLNGHVRVRELSAWGFDENRYRSAVKASTSSALEGKNERPFSSIDPVSSELPEILVRLLDEHHARGDLQREMEGLDWRTGLVDLRKLVAFQRRLVIDSTHVHAAIPAGDDWEALVALAFGPPVSIAYEQGLWNGCGYWLRSENPNLQMRPPRGSTGASFELYGGSPFFEVGEYRGRWFLRDGYHRAFRLLQANVTHVPAVIVRARTLAELGAAQPWFFAEETLFSAIPPMVFDFVDDALTIEYSRPRLFKTIRVRIEETMEPVTAACSGGETL